MGSCVPVPYLECKGSCESYTVVADQIARAVLFFFWLPCGIRSALGQGSDLSHSCNLCHSCSNTGSLTHCSGPGTEPAGCCQSCCTIMRTPSKRFCFICGMQKFLGQRSSPCHSCNQSHSNDNTRSFTHRATRELQAILLFSQVIHVC